MQKLYLATPYSHPDLAVREARYTRVTQAATFLMLHGYYVYSPITHNHPMIVSGKLPSDWNYWGEFDRMHLEWCHELVVFRQEGWDRSVGVAAEVAIALKRGMPVHYLETGILAAWEESGCLPPVSEALLTA
jgi:hypothetical protein